LPSRKPDGEAETKIAELKSALTESVKARQNAEANVEQANATLGKSNRLSCQEKTCIHELDWLTQTAWTRRGTRSCPTHNATCGQIVGQCPGRGAYRL
jgi:hypothetical protein